MTNYEVVKKLIGDIRPKGDSSRDTKIFDNLKMMCELHAEIHKAIDEVSYDFKDDKQASVKTCCDYASNYIQSLGIVE